MSGHVLTEELRSDVRIFAFYVGNNTLLSGSSYFDTVSYNQMFVDSPDLIGTLFAVYMNNMRAQKDEPDERATHWLLSLLVETYVVSPPLEDWELKISDEAIDGFSAIQMFALQLGQNKLAPGILSGVQYIPLLFDGGSFIEAIFTVFTNNIRIDGNGKVANYEHAKRRATQYIRGCIDSSYEVTPPFEDWELELM
jgi:hypothetical protein